MEFSELGAHCGEKSCRQLDFLPMKCDACSKLFCSDHLFYESHTCPQSYTKDVQVPVCPLCNNPVPTPRGSSPDSQVLAHMESDSCGAKRKKNASWCLFRPKVHPQDHICGSANSTTNSGSKAPRSQTQAQIEQDHLLALALPGRIMHHARRLHPPLLIRSRV
ncbi:AN1-type zinc finger protein 2A,AN1-type zinc finger protein 2B [Lepeophtheirus salmonis]|uniref:AN1-type zinc finger protein 2A,AN1-type zinc finger protein 2B n=1 Tax=Lepeophtheirus salmonis TaxID=72036 RepID=A0A817F8F1_LEPSM|nr:AN1-type zinc finger protein 2A,AN1-type zinc finger protein 2B [Lepeophtheirus salmonis]CAG9474906.1 AN1-type zinc finger protein 2A,AN1-type zinc finger protein 2B [Lepeophtheirus salmonis]